MVQLDTSILSMKGQLNRGKYKISAAVNDIFNALNAVSYISAHIHA